MLIRHGDAVPVLVALSIAQKSTLVVGLYSDGRVPSEFQPVLYALLAILILILTIAPNLYTAIPVTGVLTSVFIASSIFVRSFFTFSINTSLIYDSRCPAECVDGGVKVMVYS